MKITLTNKSYRDISTDFGLLRSNGRLSVNNVTPDQAFNAAASLKPLVDNGVLVIDVQMDSDRLDSLEPVMAGMLESTGIYDENTGNFTEASGAYLVGVNDPQGYFAGENVEEILSEIGQSIGGLDKVAGNVAQFQTPGSATAADVATKLNQLIQSLITAGLMLPPN